MASAELNNTTIPSVTKSITQVKINQFESCGILERENIHNSPELALSLIHILTLPTTPYV